MATKKTLISDKSYFNQNPNQILPCLKLLISNYNLIKKSPQDNKTNLKIIMMIIKIIKIIKNKTRNFKIKLIYKPKKLVHFKENLKNR